LICLIGMGKPRITEGYLESYPKSGRKKREGKKRSSPIKREEQERPPAGRGDYNLPEGEKKKEKMRLINELRKRFLLLVAKSRKEKKAKTLSRKKKGRKRTASPQSRRWRGGRSFLRAGLP